MNKVIAIIGRPNTGKSTLFNRIIGKRQAIVHPTSGVTRDRNHGEAEWTGKKFFLIDTGGYVPDSDELFEKAINDQIKLAIEESDKIIFTVDTANGLHPIDKDIANLLRKFKGEKDIILVANKSDNNERDANATEFYSLGFDEPVSVSGLNGRNVADLLDMLTEDISETEEIPDERFKIAIVGRPNAGKSSLSNALLKEERNIVTDIPGTTRDSIDSVLKYYNEEIVLIDTAGLRKKSKIDKEESLEFFSTVRTYKAIQRCDIAIVVIDATLIMEQFRDTTNMKDAIFRLDRQDIRIIDEVVTLNKGILIVINKWDLIEKDSKTSEIVRKKIEDHLKSFGYLEIIFISALTKQRIHRVLESATSIYEERKKKIKTSELNEFLEQAKMYKQPPAVQGKDLKLNYVTQVKSAPPVFAFFCNEPKMIPENYKKYLENTFRKKFGFRGVPITFVYRKKN
ncbi:MAG TPA: ribosome biogenesis GTPase Der [Ignavibacteria bacterium]|nr:ribosome biogenesis GTPase Der [Ignavibacteria bacterium]